MNTPDVLAALRAAGVTLTADGDRLNVDAPRGALDDERRAALVSQKADLLGLLDAERRAIKDETERHGWATITLLWPPTSTVPCPRGKWRRLDDGSIETTYTRDELCLALAAAGVDVAASR